MKETPGGRRLDVPAALVALVAAAFLFGGVFSALAPCGAWGNVLLGATMWSEGDPAGYYIASAHELYRFHGRLLYPGHPGLILQILLHALQAALYALAAPADRALGFSAFIAKDLAQVFFLSKMLITGVHAATFVLLYPFAHRLLRRERAALLAVFGYATSLPVLYYLSRVSVEPMMMLFLFASFLCVWRSLDERARPRQASLWAALAGAASVCGLATKFHLLWPLPAACLGQLLWGEALPWKRARSGAARSAILSFVAAAVAALALSSLLLDWRDFFAYWGVGGMQGAPAGAVQGLAARLAGVLLSVARGAAGMPVSAWIPSTMKSGVYFLCEVPMTLAAAFGAARLFRREGFGGRWFWLAALTVYTVVIWAYRCIGVDRDFYGFHFSVDFHGFHYLFVFTALAAVFFGEAADSLLARLRWSARAEASAAALGIGLIHFLPLRAVIGSRLRDAAEYDRVRAFREALAEAPAGARVAVAGGPAELAVLTSGLAVLRDSPPDESALVDALRADYVSADRAELERLMSAPSVGERPVSSVVAIGTAGGVPVVRGPFDPARWSPTAGAPSARP